MASLLKKGFRKKDTHHAYFHLWIGDKKTVVYTKLSHGSNEVSDQLVSEMARQVKLTRKQFCDLVDCPLSQESYIELLRNSGHV